MKLLKEQDVFPQLICSVSKANIFYSTSKYKQFFNICYMLSTVNRDKLKHK